MPDNILHRTAFIEFDNRPVMQGKGVYRPTDWALVKTTDGMMVEPFQLFEYSAPDVDISNYDPEEELRRVDQIELVSLDNFGNILSQNDGIVLHGGNLVPRAGR